MTQEQYRLLRSVIDFDGLLDQPTAKRLLSGLLDPTYFDEYDSKSLEFKRTSGSRIAEFALAYFDVYNMPPTDDALSTEVNERGNLNRFEQEDLYKELGQMRPMVVNPNDVDYYIDRVQEQFLSTKAIQAMMQNMQTIKDNPRQGVDHLVKRLTEVSARVTTSQQRLENKALRLSQFASYLREEFVDKGELMSGALPYPYKEWNQVLGGMYPGDLIVIAGPSNVGKSFIAHDIGFNVGMDLGLPTVFADREMQHKQNGTRFMSRMTGIPSRILRKKELQTPEEQKVIMAAMDEYAAYQGEEDSILFIPPTLCANALQIRRKIEMEGIDPVLIVQDYMSIMESVRKGMGGWEEIKQIANDLKQLALHFSCPVVALAQTDDGGKIQYKEIKRVCDTLIILSEDKDQPYVHPQQGEYIGQPGIINAFVEKSRNDAKYVNMRLEVEYATASIREAPPKMRTKVGKAAKARSPYTEGDDNGDDRDEI